MAHWLPYCRTSLTFPSSFQLQLFYTVLSSIFHNYLHILCGYQLFMTLDKRNCIIRIAFCTLDLVSLWRFLCVRFFPSVFRFIRHHDCRCCYCRCLCCVAEVGFRFNSFAINSKRIFPWLFCLWSALSCIRISYSIVIWCAIL